MTDQQTHEEKLSLPRPLANGSAEAEPGEILIATVSPVAVEGVWHRMEGHIRTAINASDINAKLETPQDVKQRCLDGDYQLVAITEGNELKAAVILSYMDFPRTRVCTINYCGGGEIDWWITDFYHFIVEGSRNLGCRFVKIDGRYAWIKKLEKLGFKETSTEFTLEI